MNERENQMLDSLQESIDVILGLPDHLFESGTGRDLLKSMINQLNLESVGNTQIEDFKKQKLSYNQVEIMCRNLVDDSEDLLDSLNELQTSPEKIVFLKEIFGNLTKLPEYILANYPRYDAVIPIELCHPNAKLPTYAHDGDAGADVYVLEDVTIEGNKTVLIPTGIKMAIPEGWMVSVRPRSGLSLKTTLRVGNAPGTIDHGYLSEVGIIVTNIGDAAVTLKQGDRVAQFVLERAYKADFIPTNNVAEHNENRANEKGEQGFGSTGT